MFALVGVKGTHSVVQSLCGLGLRFMVHCRENSAGLSPRWAECGRLAL